MKTIVIKDPAELGEALALRAKVNHHAAVKAALDVKKEKRQARTIKHGITYEGYVKP